MSRKFLIKGEVIQRDWTLLNEKSKIAGYNCKKAFSLDTPTDELCTVYFERWFYNSEEDSCQQISYSGCNEWGFESLEACQECYCD